MSITLHLGVKELPYAHEEHNSLASTGDVAEYLEKKYGVIQGFYDLNEAQIVEAITLSMQNSIQSVLQGADPLTHDPFGTATSFIDHKFHEFISTEQLAQSGKSGVPTEAALKGKSSRFKLGRNGRIRKRGKSKQGARRPSFLDTGLYDSSFIAWVEVK